MQQNPPPPKKKSTTSTNSLKLVHFNVTNTGIHNSQVYLYYFSFVSDAFSVSKQDVAFSLTPLKAIVPVSSVYFTGRQTAGA